MLSNTFSLNPTLPGMTRPKGWTWSGTTRAAQERADQCQCGEHLPQEEQGLGGVFGLEARCAEEDKKDHPGPAGVYHVFQGLIL